MVNFCTLFDINYIERGLVLYDSLKILDVDFRLYIVAFDDITYETLNNLNLEKAVVVRVEDIENDTLLEAKKKRSKRAYCWTCSAWSILYFIKTYDLEYCTYIDADEYYYADPTPLIHEFIKSGKSVGIISHHYGERKYAKRMEQSSGKYCVQFNTFKNDEKGMKVLEEWCVDCANCCEEYSDGKNFGDQKYVEEWPQKYDCIYEYAELGAGVAPWNIYRYRLTTNDGFIYDRVTKSEAKLYFVHFHNLLILDKYADINVYTRYGRHDKMLVNTMYREYLEKIKEVSKRINMACPKVDEYKNYLQKVNEEKKPLLLRIKGKGPFIFFKESVKYRLKKRDDLLVIESKE